MPTVVALDVNALGAAQGSEVLEAVAGDIIVQAEDETEATAALASWGLGQGSVLGKQLLVAGLVVDVDRDDVVAAPLLAEDHAQVGGPRAKASERVAYLLFFNERLLLPRGVVGVLAAGVSAVGLLARAAAIGGGGMQGHALEAGTYEGECVIERRDPSENTLWDTKTRDRRLRLHHVTLREERSRSARITGS